MIDEATVLAVRAGVHSRPFQDELIVLDLVAGEYYALEVIGARVWREFEQGRSLAEVVNALTPEYDVTAVQLQQDVVHLAKAFVQRGLMVEKR